MATARKITHTGELDLNGFKIPCYVLEDGTRILSGRGMQSSLKLLDEDGKAEKRSGARFTRFLATKGLNPFLFKDKDLGHYHPILTSLGVQPIAGYEATLLADLCDAVLEARAAGALKTERQQTVATQCEILIRAFARVGIIALVDEATGYQFDREKDELQKILKAYVADDIQDWQLTFLNSFYQEIFRLRKWPFTPGDIRKRPGVVGLYTIRYIYNMLPPGVFKTIKAKTPRSAAGNPTARYFQFLTPDQGYKHLEQQLRTVITLLQVSRSWTEFEDLFARKFGQRALDFDEKPELPKQLPPAKPKSDFDIALTGLLNVPPPPKEPKGEEPMDKESDDEEPTSDEEPKKPRKPKTGK